VGGSVNDSQRRSNKVFKLTVFFQQAMEKEQKANNGPDDMQIDKECSKEVPKRGKQKRLRGSEKTEAEIVPNNTGRKQGFVNYAVTYGNVLLECLTRADLNFENFL
jgi:hypothetical protein